MRVIPVLDLKAGRAVLARRGERESYAPVRSVLMRPERAGDGVALARAFRERLGCEECYVADLDAIAGGSPQRPLVRAVASEYGGRVLVDAGVAHAGRARQLVADGVGRVVVGLETLASFDALRAIAGAIGPERVAFSLDLRGGEPLSRGGAPPHAGSPLELAGAAVAAGAAAVILLDLARVGTGAGVDVALLAGLRRALPGVELLAGGGIGSRADLERLADSGADAALVASAVHDGRIGRDAIDALRSRPPACLT